MEGEAPAEPCWRIRIRLGRSLALHFNVRINDVVHKTTRWVPAAAPESAFSLELRTVLACHRVHAPVRRCRAGSPNPAALDGTAGYGDPAPHPPASFQLSREDTG
jgi:hypothetical protein